LPQDGVGAGAGRAGHLLDGGGTDGGAWVGAGGVLLVIEAADGEESVRRVDVLLGQGV
jgi:hypothetical protein